MYLLDTNVISETRRPRPHGGVLAWLEAHRRTKVFLSAVTIGELQVGVEKLRGRDDFKAAQIDRWIGSVIQTFAVLVVDDRAFRVCARLMHGRSKSLIMDALIAAVAETEGLRIVTRNRRDFAILGVETINPFEHGRA